MLRHAAKPVSEVRDATVTMLGEYLNRHAREERGEALPRASRGVDVVAIGHDLRASPLAPRQNHLLAALNDEDYARLLPHLELVALPRGGVLCEAHSNPDCVYFPTTGIVSIVYELENGTSVEVAVAGSDGMIGVAVFMGGGTTTSRAVVRNTGYGYRLGADVLRREFESSPSLRQWLLRYAQALLTQMAQTAVCHGHHPLEQQFCRLLLASMDRLRSDDVALTQDTMANLLGVRRESITAAAGKLQSAGLIRYHRGRITVLNRPRLEALVCECYAAAKAELDRLVPQHLPAVHATAMVSHSHSRCRGDAPGSVPVERYRSSGHPMRAAAGSI